MPQGRSPLPGKPSRTFTGKVWEGQICLLASRFGMLATPCTTAPLRTVNRENASRWCPRIASGSSKWNLCYTQGSSNSCWHLYRWGCRMQEISFTHSIFRSQCCLPPGFRLLSTHKQLYWTLLWKLLSFAIPPLKEVAEWHIRLPPEQGDSLHFSL